MTWSYIAGFFDGEGSITNNGKGFRITIAQTNRDVLEEIKRFAGIGSVITVTKRRSHWKDSWVYYIANQKDVLRFLSSVYGVLIVKKELAKRTIPTLKTIVENQERRRSKRKRLVVEAKKLRTNGFTYREIGKKLGIDFGYARRLILQRKSMVAIAQQ